MKKHYGRKSPASRVKFMLLAAIIAVSLLLVTAFAAMNYLGMQEITQGTTYEVPSEASPYIETQSAQATTTEDWSCTMLESLFDSASFTISVGISGGDKYVVVPEYCSASDDVSEIGLPSGQTLGTMPPSRARPYCMLVPESKTGTSWALQRQPSFTRVNLTAK